MGKLIGHKKPDELVISVDTKGYYETTSGSSFASGEASKRVYVSKSKRNESQVMFGGQTQKIESVDYRQQNEPAAPSSMSDLVVEADRRKDGRNFKQKLSATQFQIGGGNFDSNADRFNKKQYAILDKQAQSGPSSPFKPTNVQQYNLLTGASTTSGGNSRSSTKGYMARQAAAIDSKGWWPATNGDDN